MAPITQNMKLIRLAKPAGLGIMLSILVISCHKTPNNMTKVPDYKKGLVQDMPSTNLYNPDTLRPPEGPQGGIPVSDPTVREKWSRDREALKAETVYFAFDSSAVKDTEKSKVAAVAE